MVFICIVMVYSYFCFVNENHEEFSTEYYWQLIFFNFNVDGKYFGIYNKKNKYNLLRMDKKGGIL